MQSHEFEELILERISNLVPPADCDVVERSTPVISFGDFTKSHIATLGINPSASEFQSGGKLLKGERKRLADEENGLLVYIHIHLHLQLYLKLSHST